MTKPPYLLIASLVALVGFSATYRLVSDGRDRIEYSRIETDGRCDRFSTLHPRGLCYVANWNMDAPPKPQGECAPNGTCWTVYYVPGPGRETGR